MRIGDQISKNFKMLEEDLQAYIEQNTSKIISSSNGYKLDGVLKFFFVSQPTTDAF